MSYVTLPIHAPHPKQAQLMGFGAEANYEELKAKYDACTRSNRDANAAYQAALKAWKAAKKAYEAYLVEAKRVGAKNMSIDSAYASKRAVYAAKSREYEAAMAAWLDKYRQYQNCVEFFKASDAQQQQEAEALAKTYNVQLKKTGTWWCISAAEKKRAEQECAAITQTVRGIGALDIRGMPVCMLKNYPTCKTHSCPSHPGKRPTAPKPPSPPPPHLDQPKAVPDPGAKPKAPSARDCGPAPIPPSMGLGTAGLIAILAIGGGVVGYRWYKKRKKAA